MKKIYLFLFITILVLGFVLRFFNLGKTPNSLNWDEVSWGYNAYSVLKTGYDEHGAFMPLSFKAFGDFKQPVYVYITSLSVAAFGLNELGARFPSAFLGILTIPFVWLLVFELFRKDKYRYQLALAVMFFFAVSPWSIQFSRVAYEANIGLFFVISGVALFLRGLNLKKYWWSYFGIIFLAISGYSYHSEKIFTPILFAALLFFAYKSFNITKKYLVIFLVLFILGNLLWIIDARTTARGRSVTFLSNQTQILQNSTQDLIYDNLHNNKIGDYFHNRRIVYANYYLQNYLSHFNPNWLFISGDNARHHSFGMGILYLVSLPLILAGFILLDKKKYWLVIFWFFLAPIASSLAIDAPNASRSLIFLPTWQIFEGVGLVSLVYMNKGKLKTILIYGFSILFFVNFIYYIHNYFTHTNNEYAIYWQYGYKEAMLEAAKYINTDRKVVFSDKYEQPYIFYLFYTKYDPEKYIVSGGSDGIIKSCFNIDNIYFGKCMSQISKGDLYITQTSVNNNKFKKIKDITGSKGEILGEIYESM